LLIGVQGWFGLVWFREINIKPPETTCEGERKHFVGMEQLLKEQVKNTDK
jgi:hypothetical protein